MSSSNVVPTLRQKRGSHYLVSSSAGNNASGLSSLEVFNSIRELPTIQRITAQKGEGFVLSTICPRISVQHKRVGDVVYKENEIECDGFYSVYSGECEGKMRHAIIQNESRTRVSTYDQNRAFGCFDVIEPKRRVETVTVTQPNTILLHFNGQLQRKHFHLVNRDILEEQLAQLRMFPCFCGVGQRTLVGYLPLVEMRTYSRGHTVYSIGSSVDYVHFIIQGDLSVYAKLPISHRLNLERICATPCRLFTEESDSYELMTQISLLCSGGIFGEEETYINDKNNAIDIQFIIYGDQSVKEFLNASAISKKKMKLDKRARLQSDFNSTGLPLLNRNVLKKRVKSKLDDRVVDFQKRKVNLNRTSKLVSIDAAQAKQQQYAFDYDESQEQVIRSPKAGEEPIIMPEIAPAASDAVATAATTATQPTQGDFDMSVYDPVSLNKYLKHVFYGKQMHQYPSDEQQQQEQVTLDADIDDNKEKKEGEETKKEEQNQSQVEVKNEETKLFEYSPLNSRGIPKHLQLQAQADNYQRVIRIVDKRALKFQLYRRNLISGKTDNKGNNGEQSLPYTTHPSIKRPDMVFSFVNSRLVKLDNAMEQQQSKQQHRSKSVVENSNNNSNISNNRLTATTTSVSPIKVRRSPERYPHHTHQHLWDENDSTRKSSKQKSLVIVESRKGSESSSRRIRTMPNDLSFQLGEDASLLAKIRQSIAEKPGTVRKSFAQQQYKDLRSTSAAKNTGSLPSSFFFTAMPGPSTPINSSTRSRSRSKNDESFNFLDAHDLLQSKHLSSMMTQRHQSSSSASNKISSQSSQLIQ